jgi:succinate dehydrogenase / fumarate reductase cytochrome b subunit
MKATTVDESRPLPRTSIIAEFWASTIGKKIVMAVTGLVLVGFVIAHMVGNLKLYQGEAKFNAYAVWLREMGGPAVGHEQALWAARLVLLLAVVLHMVAAWQLARRSWAARPVAYQERKAIQATYASRTMRWGGVIVLLFIVYHILHLTFGVIGFPPGEFKHLSVYKNVVAGFSVWYVSVFYILANLALGLHLFHGVWSMFQTIGLSGFGMDRFYRGIATVVALAVVLGNISIPIAVLSGVVR